MTNNKKRILGSRSQLVAVVLLLFLVFFGIAPASRVFAALAASDASFSLSPLSGSYQVGAVFSVTVSETSSVSDNTNSVQANLSYNSSLLQYTSTSIGAFTLCAQNTGGGGLVNIGCASTSPPTLSGTQTVATVSFKVIATGTASVNMVSGSDIHNTSGQSIWNGNLPQSASFSLSAATSSTVHKSSSSPTTTTPNKETKPPATKSNTASVVVTVTDSAGKPLKNAKVVIDNRQTAYTNTKGQATFPSATAGRHTVAVTAAGKKFSQTELTVTAGKNKQAAIRLASNTSPLVPILYAVIGLAVIAVAGLAYLHFSGRRLNVFHFLRRSTGNALTAADTGTNAGVVTGNATSPPLNTSPSAVPATPQQPAFVQPQSEAPQTPPADKPPIQ